MYFKDEKVVVHPLEVEFGIFTGECHRCGIIHDDGMVHLCLDCMDFFDDYNYNWNKSSDFYRQHLIKNEKKALQYEEENRDLFFD